MDKFVKNNQVMLLTELENKSVPLADDAKAFLDNIGNLDSNEEHYVLFRGEKIAYELLSFKNILNFDKRILSSKEKSSKYETLRSLRIAGSHVLIGARHQVVLAETLRSLVIYPRNGEEYVIDYAHNLIMKKVDYEKICPYTVIEEINQCDLCYVAHLIKNADSQIPLPLILICFDEIKKDLQKRVPNYVPKFHSNGINSANDFVLDIDNETLFWLDADYYSEYCYDANVIDHFTLNPLAIRLPIEQFEDKKYRYKDYEFSLFSDHVIGDEIKEELLSDERSGKCFQKSIETLFGMVNMPDDRKKVVLGNIKIREFENFLHAVAMFKSVKTDKWNMVDYTINLIMESDDYAKLKNYTIINEIPYEVMYSLYDYLVEWGPQIDKFLLLYFGEEMLRDLERNKSLFKGMK